MRTVCFVYQNIDFLSQHSLDQRPGRLWLVRIALGHLGVHPVDLRGFGDILAMSFSSPWSALSKAGLPSCFDTWLGKEELVSAVSAAPPNLPLGASFAAQGRGQARLLQPQGLPGQPVAAVWRPLAFVGIPRVNPHYII